MTDLSQVVVPIQQIREVMFGLHDPVGLFVNQTILILFAAAAAELLLALLRIGGNAWYLTRARWKMWRRPSDAAPPEQLADFLKAIGLSGMGRWSLVGQRVRDLFALKERGPVDLGVVKEITGESVSFVGGFSRFVAGTLTVIGLVGTVLGLTLAMSKLPALAEQVKSTGDMNAFLDQVLQTLGGMKTAFSCTLTGLVSSIVLSILNFTVQRLQAALFVKLERFSNYELVPAITHVTLGDATEAFVERMTSSGTVIAAALAQVDTATQRFTTGAESVTAAAKSMNEATGALVEQAERAAETSENIQEAEKAFSAAAESVSRSVDAMGNHVERLGTATRSLVDATGGLGSLNSLSERLRDLLGEVVDAAVTRAVERQDEITETYRKNLAELHADHVLLLEGVQHTIDALTVRAVQGLEKTIAALNGRQDEVAAELRTLAGRLSPEPVVAELRELRNALTRDGGNRWKSRFTAPLAPSGNVPYLPPPVDPWRGPRMPQPTGSDGVAPLSHTDGHPSPLRSDVGDGARGPAPRFPPSRYGESDHGSAVATPEASLPPVDPQPRPWWRRPFGGR